MVRRQLQVEACTAFVHGQAGEFSCFHQQITPADPALERDTNRELVVGLRTANFMTCHCQFCNDRLTTASDTLGGKEEADLVELSYSG